MKWNWQQEDWPHFSYNTKALQDYEKRFLIESGALWGAYKHLDKKEQDHLRVELISEEGIKTSEIEGEYLNRASIQASIRRQFGIEKDDKKIPLAEQGIAEMMIDLYRTYREDLTQKKLFEWHKMLLQGQRLEVIGGYRIHQEPMQVVSGAIGKKKVHFEAPPSSSIPKEMVMFIDWFNTSAPQKTNELPALTRAGIAHLYFVSILPFEDGNGRIARALSEKSLSQSLEQPTLIALSHAIEKHRKLYYQALEQANKSNEITDWLVYFSQTVLEAVSYTRDTINFLVTKGKFLERFRGKLNNRQEKVILRLFKEGVEGFKGGLSAENYISITKISRATATRDLQDLVEKGAFKKKGELKFSRYFLKI